ncbi:hypothetical protein AKJ62_03295 [candidate division MSBL1 archaeon SCGC-AAA259D14]|uniref:Uncharacterized protein n=1 Tax=candidate division MSBL1 archaeon SCGC-AAA259D14 TaxID=1698261 RepID=A0A133U593_9EURY|nr:hypothetical protein AKJ62_03295 [candidate division MSBL1 archaeon SCGC-AAA259D14]
MKCKFEDQKTCSFDELPDDAGWCQACAILELASTQKTANEINRLKVLYELRETFLETLPYQRPDITDSIKNRLIEETEKFQDGKTSTLEKEELAAKIQRS